MKFLTLALISAAMLLGVSASSAMADGGPPTWEAVSDTSFAGTDNVSPRLWIETHDEPVTVWYEYGGSPSYGHLTKKTTIDANSAEYYVEGVYADYAGGWVYYKFHIETPTREVPGYASSSPTRGALPVNLVPPTVEGNPYPGHVLTCNPGKWNVDDISATFKWNGFTPDLFDPMWVSRVFMPSILVTEDDLGKKVSCTARKYRSRVGGESVESSVVVIVPEPPAPAGSVSSTATRSCTAPKVLGLTLNAARARLTSANCAVGAISHTWSTSVRKGRVLKSTRSANGQFALVVSKGKKPKTRR